MDQMAEPRERPKMATWLWERGLTAAFLGEKTNSTRQAASNWLRPFDDPRRVVPSEEVIGICVVMTRGVITAADWYPPSLNSHAGAAA
jgi:hypothetical protein